MTRNVHYRRTARNFSEEESNLENLALGQRIRAHRLALGMSLRELSSYLPVSAQALNQYEHGNTQPRLEILENLADVFGTTTDHLLRDLNKGWLGSVQIQHTRKCTGKSLKKVKSVLIMMAENRLSLEHRLGGVFPAPSLPLMEDIRLIRNPEDAEVLAQTVRRSWGLGIGPLPQLVSSFEARGIRVFEAKSGENFQQLEACSAFIFFSGGTLSITGMPVVMLNGILSGEDKRFLLCSELAYMILPSVQNKILQVKKREKIANWFAGALLLPTAALRHQLGRKRKTLSWYELREVNQLFGISFECIVRRCLEAGIVSRETYRELIDQCQKRRLKENLDCQDRMSHSVTESSTWLMRSAIRAITQGIITPKEAAVLLDVKQEEINAAL